MHVTASGEIEQAAVLMTDGDDAVLVLRAGLLAPEHVQLLDVLLSTVPVQRSLDG